VIRSSACSGTSPDRRISSHTRGTASPGLGAHPQTRVFVCLDDGNWAGSASFQQYLDEHFGRAYSPIGIKRSLKKMEAHRR